MSVWLLWNSLSASRRWSLFSRSFIFIISSSSSSFFRLVSHHPIPPVLLFSPSPSFRFDFDFVSVSPPHPPSSSTPVLPCFLPLWGSLDQRAVMVPDCDNASCSQKRRLESQYALRRNSCVVYRYFFTPDPQPPQFRPLIAPLLHHHHHHGGRWFPLRLCAVLAPPSPVAWIYCVKLKLTSWLLHVSNERDAGSWKLETEVRETSSSRDVLDAAASCSVGLVVHSLRERMEVKGTLPHDDDEADLLSVQCVKNIKAMTMLESVLTSGNQGEGQLWRLECGTRGRPTYKCPMGVNI